MKLRTEALALVLSTATLLLAVAVAGCARGPQLAPTTSFPATTTRVTTVYLAPVTGGRLTAADLDAHPAVTVVRSQAELESAVQTTTAVWIDKSAVGTVDGEWLRARAAERCPVALIGYGNALYSFRETLSIAGIKGPYVDWSRVKLEPGFSVWMTRTRSATGTSAFMQGFSETPTVDAVSKVTDSLLQGARE